MRQRSSLSHEVPVLLTEVESKQTGREYQEVTASVQTVKIRENEKDKGTDTSVRVEFKVSGKRNEASEY